VYLYVCVCKLMCLCQDVLKTQRRVKPLKCHQLPDLCYQNWLESLDSHVVLKINLEESPIRRQYRTPDNISSPQMRRHGNYPTNPTDLKKQPTKKFLLLMYHLTTD